jgi:hypothetical protein
MELRFHLDPDTELPHIYDHGVTEDEVRHVLARPGLNLPAGRNARSIMGQTAAGRYLKVVLVPDEGGQERIRRHGLRVARQGAQTLPARQEEKEAMKKQRMPQGWTAKQIRALAKRHDNMTDDDVAAEIDAGLKKKNQTVMVVPTELVPEITRLIAKKRPA